MEYSLVFLQNNGFFGKGNSVELEDQINKSLKIAYSYDLENKLAYFNNFKISEIVEIVNYLREHRNITYFWFWNDNRLQVYRSFGEVKNFIFNLNIKHRSDYIKSKQDLLNQFSSQYSAIIFSEKAIVSKFYQELWKERIKLAKSIVVDISDQNKILFAQRVLDRLIFLYFLVEKGIIHGIKEDKNINIHAKPFFSHIANTNNFYETLSKIFYEDLNDENNTIFEIEGFPEYKFIIPYLNGGLFSIKDIERNDSSIISEQTIKFIDFEWSNLINIFNQYNWIIDDVISNDDSMVGNITPEILGSIYEKFVITITNIDNISFDELEKFNFTSSGMFKKGTKSAGAYYTPEHITHYMTENAIFTKISQLINIHEECSNFNEFYDKNEMNKDKLKKFTRHLLDIKILDPAVGSGAFLLASANIVFDWALLTGTFNNKYDLRKKIISSMLYGIDIMPGAIEICKLRLWLWLVASIEIEEKIEPLPNIDFNIIRGNSLVGNIKKVKSTYKSGGYIPGLEKFFGEQDDYWERRNNLIAEYKKSSGKNAKKLKNQIVKFTRDKKEALDREYFNDLKERGYNKNFQDFQGQFPVHILLQFSEVFTIKGGFDIIIGNPPYYQTRKDEAFKFTNAYEDIYESTRLNIASVFVNRCLKILGAESILAMIVPKGFAYTGGWSKLRTKILTQYQLINLVDCGKAFSGVKLEQIIFYLQNKGDFQLKKSKINIGNLKDEKITVSHQIPQSLCKENDKLHLEVEPISYRIKKKMEKSGIKIADLNIKIYRGLPNKFVATSKSKRTINGLKGKDISPFFVRSHTNLDLDIIESSNSSKTSSNNENILFQRILAHISNHIKMTGVRNTSNLPTISTVSNLEITGENKYSSKYLIGLLHSSLMNFYIHKFIYCNAIRSMDLDRYYLEQIPLPKLQPDNIKKLIHLIEKIEAQNEELTDFESFQGEIDNIIFSDYGLNSNEIKFVKKYIIS